MPVCAVRGVVGSKNRRYWDRLPAKEDTTGSPGMTAQDADMNRISGAPRHTARSVYVDEYCKCCKRG